MPAEDERNSPPLLSTRKGDRPAPDFLRTLYRLGRLTPAELDGRLRALKDLAAGKLRPVLAPV
jgi:hypothetical protein